MRRMWRIGSRGLEKWYGVRSSSCLASIVRKKAGHSALVLPVFQDRAMLCTEGLGLVTAWLKGAAGRGRGRIG
jgi:hypothetical protein